MTFQDSPVLGTFTGEQTETFLKWRDRLRAMFPVADEYDLASAIYSFGDDYLNNLSPQQAYDNFDTWAAQ